ncbi:MAG: hypothetical protein J0G95_11020 [Rhizobiales bacterium]|nr:hypothetical protein [Hyphomicrobiales bacterium]
MSDDLVNILRDPKFIGQEAMRDSAAAHIEAQAAEIEASKAERIEAVHQGAYLSDRAEKAERALAVAVEVMRPFAKAGDLLSFAGVSEDDEIELSGEKLKESIEAARQFVKEHGK